MVLEAFWWLERAAAILFMFSMGVYEAVIIGTTVTQPSIRIETTYFVIFAILTFATRRVKSRCYV
ncbi:hypothetical protein GCM10009825_22040 [Arthrobacter humicola]|uniref:Uncharacterized protein n=1 Tax=Arthrobacter humicola TaxID=409291 RepID=A0ABP5KXG6_9MICC